MSLDISDAELKTLLRSLQTLISWHNEYQRKTLEQFDIIKAQIISVKARLAESQQKQNDINELSSQIKKIITTIQSQDAKARLAK